MAHLPGVDQQVLGLDVPMDDVLAVAVLDRLQQLVDVLADQVELDAVGVLLEDLEQILLQVLEDEVQAVASVTQKKETRVVSFQLY